MKCTQESVQVVHRQTRLHDMLQRLPAAGCILPDSVRPGKPTAQQKATT